MTFYRLILHLIVCLPAAVAFGEPLRMELSGPSHAVPIKIFLPEAKEEKTPVVLFSHGLGGSREGAVYLGEHWSGAGYVVIMLQHPGSDLNVWKGVPKWKIRKALKDAASVDSFNTRVSDVTVVLDFIEDAAEDPTHPLYGKIDTTRIALSGHSFGAVTTQAIMGQSFLQPEDQPFMDTRVDCFILMSPSQSKRLSNEDAFGAVALPVLCMTGTKDDSPLRNHVTPETRKEVYAALPPGQAYQVVFHEGEHSIFGDRREHDPRYHAVILEVTTQFLDAYLREDEDSLNWLRSDTVRESLTPEDTWEWK